MITKPNDNVEKVFDEIGELRQIRKTLEKRQPHWTDHFRVVTPIGLAIVGYFLSIQTANFNRLDTDIKDMRMEISHHLQNSELHVPRSTVTSKDEFVIYQAMRDRQMADLQCTIARIQDLLEKRLSNGVSGD